jgi:hypothetical protein
MKTESGALVSIVREQWSRVLDMWEGLIRSIPDDEWARGELGYLTPARHAIHALDQYDPAEWFGAEVRASPFDIPSEILWSKEKALAKLAETRAILNERVAGFDLTAALFEPETAHPWAGPTRLDKMLYVLRHSQHHLGAVEAELSRRGIRAATWEKEKAARLEIAPWW